MDGSQAHLRLSDEELTRYAQELGANVATLPYATCRLCGGVHGLGEIGIDEYGRGAGYGLSWEGVEPTGAHLLGAVIRLDYLQRASNPHSNVVTDYPKCRAWLAWLARLDAPQAYHAITPTDSADMARSNRPGHGAPGTDAWLWRGAIYQASCPPLAGRCYISLAQAMPPDESFSLSRMFATWRAIAQITLQGKIAGEEEAQGEAPA
jgi:hypothetical protein